MAYIDLTLLQFQKTFSTEEACLDAIFEARWPRGFVCPKCGHNNGIRLKSRIRIVECNSCHRQTSITSNTLFHRSHLPLVVWFLCIYLCSKDKGGVSATRLGKQVGVSYPTAWFVLQRLRIAMQTRDENLTLAGYIELDEAFFGGRSKGNKGRKPGFDKVKVVILVESEGKQAGNLVMRVVDDIYYDDLKPVIEEKVESEPGGQRFRADGWGSHHVVIDCGHSINMHPVRPVQKLDEVLRCVSLAASLAKRFLIGTYHHYCRIHIQRYLDEFCYRWNRRHLFSELPSHLLTASILTNHVPFSRVKQTAQTA